MAILKNKLKINRISLDFENYYFFIKGVEKCGKTTLARDLTLKLYGKADAGLLLAIGKEKGYKALDNIQALDVEDWSEFEETIDDLIDNKNEYSHIKMIYIDTLDELVEMAEKETIAYSNRTTGKRVSTLNGALGGYGAGRKHLCKIVDEKLSYLKQAGYGICVLGHTKLKTIKEQGMVEEQEFQVLDSNLNTDYANIVTHKADVIATINIEREVNESKRVTDTKRYIYFRGNGFISAGSRFSNIVDKVELSADNFIKAIQDAIRDSMTDKISDAEFEKRKAEEKVENQKKADAFIEKRKDTNEVEDIAVKYEKLETIKTNMDKLDMDFLQGIMAKYSITSFGNAEIIPMACLDELLDTITG